MVSSSIVRDELLADERAIRSLSSRTGVAPAEVRCLFAQELARLKRGAKVRSYLPALTASNVRALLRSASTVATEAR
jgi:hypothetical protein